MQQLVYDYQQQVERLSACSRRETETKKKNGCRFSLLPVALLAAVCLLVFVNNAFFKS